MLNFISGMSQRKAVTVLRLLYPIWFVAGLFGVMYVPTTLIVSGDATTTANNILANELLFNMGIVSSLLTQLIFIFVVLALYKLFKPVNKNHAFLMVTFALVAVPIAMLNTLNRVAALLIVKGPDYLSAFEPAQLQSLMMFFLDLNAQGVFIASIFWGLWLFPLGYLIYKSGYFPRILGILVMLGGIGYTVDSFIRLLLPSFESIFLQALLILTIGEILFMGWLVLIGAKIPETKSTKDTKRGM